MPAKVIERKALSLERKTLTLNDVDAIQDGLEKISQRSDLLWAVLQTLDDEATAEVHPAQLIPGLMLVADDISQAADRLRAEVGSLWTKPERA